MTTTIVNFVHKKTTTLHKKNQILVQVNSLDELHFRQNEVQILKCITKNVRKKFTKFERIFFQRIETFTTGICSKEKKKLIQKSDVIINLN